MRYSKKTLSDLNIENKTVILRADYNVPVKDGKITDDNRINATLPTLNYLIEKGCKIIILSHFSRIKSLDDINSGKKTLYPVYESLKAKLSTKTDVFFSKTNYGEDVVHTVSGLKQGQILILENTRYNDVDTNTGELVKLESKNKGDLGKFWASLADIYVNDAFGTSHRAHASNVGIASHIAESCIGLLVQEELDKLSQGLDKPEKPYVAIVGGAKVSDKLNVIKTLIKEADHVLIGGGMAYTFLKAKNINIGSSLFEEDLIETAKEIIESAGSKLVLPVDHAVSSSFENSDPIYTTDISIPEGMMALDIGLNSIELYKSIISKAKTIAWNGPLGVFEFSNYNKGTLEICKSIADQTHTGAYSIIGGGDSAAAAIQLGFQKDFSHISTGGGASLSYIERSPLPGIESIQDK
jgi:phosphoglycerate kinase